MKFQLFRCRSKPVEIACSPPTHPAALHALDRRPRTALLERRQCDGDIGAGEICSLEQQGLARRFGKSIGEAVAEIQRRRMVALSESPPGAPCGDRVFSSDRDEFDGGLLQKRVERLTGRRVASPLDHHRRFKQRDGRHSARPRRRDRVFVALRVSVAEQYGKDGRGVDDHPGRPRSS